MYIVIHELDNLPHHKKFMSTQTQVPPELMGKPSQRMLVNYSTLADFAVYCLVTTYEFQPPPS
jgi:hypothetical protein